MWSFGKISAYVLKPAPQGVSQEPNLAEIKKVTMALPKSIEASEIVSA